jgi:hypothetical protein
MLNDTADNNNDDMFPLHRLFWPLSSTDWIRNTSTTLIIFYITVLDKWAKGSIYQVPRIPISACWYANFS